MMSPTDEAELVTAIKETSGPLCIAGGATRGLTVDGQQLSTAQLSGVSLYEPGALTMVAAAGTPLSEIKDLLAQEGQQLAFEPADYRGLLGTTGTPSIGSAFAANISGPRRFQAGAARDFLLGVRCVDGNGTVFKNGGRVMKNVTGYDLVKLMSGACGTLGVLSEVSFKVLPRPECTATLMWDGLGWAETLSVFTQALASAYDVTGAGRLPQTATAPSVTQVRLEGAEASVKYRLKALCDHFSVRAPDNIMVTQASSTGWEALRDVEPFHGKEGDVWRTSVKPTDMLRVVELVEFDHVVDWGGGLIWSLVPEGTDFRSHLSGLTCHSTIVRAAAPTRARLGVFHPQPAALAALARGVRAKFDPQGRFNPGLMG